MAEGCRDVCFRERLGDCFGGIYQYRLITMYPSDKDVGVDVGFASDSTVVFVVEMALYT